MSAYSSQGLSVNFSSVHYRTYDDAGEIVSKTSFGETDTSLGRVNALSIPPPHNSTSLKARLSQAEKLPAYDFKLFKDDSGEIILNSDEVLDFLSDNYPGIIADEPVAIVYDPQQAICDPIPQGFSRSLRANVACSGYPWLEILHASTLTSFVFQLWEQVIRDGTHRQRGRFSTLME